MQTKKQLSMLQRRNVATQERMYQVGRFSRVYPFPLLQNCFRRGPICKKEANPFLAPFLVQYKGRKIHSFFCSFIFLVPGGQHSAICESSLAHAQEMIDQTRNEDMGKVFKEMLCTFALVCNKTQHHLSDFKVSPLCSLDNIRLGIF